MVEIQLKRVYDSYELGDGFRVLVDRLWPRGIKKEMLHLDLWGKTVAPSDDLRKWVHEDKDARWNEFVAKYEKELGQGEALGELMEQLKAHTKVTLVFATKDAEHNHAVILKRMLEKVLSE